MSDVFVPPTIPATEGPNIPACPRRLLNERTFLKDASNPPEAPITGAKKIRLRNRIEQPVLVNDAGMVRPPTITGQQT